MLPNALVAACRLREAEQRALFTLTATAERWDKRLLADSRQLTATGGIMRRFSRCPLLVCVFTFALVASAGLARTASAADAVSSRVTQDSRVAYAESTRELPDGTTETVQLLARETVTKSARTPNAKQAVVEAVVIRVSAAGEVIHSFTGQVELAANQLSIALSLKSASLVADIPITDFFTGVSYVLSANLRWQLADTTDTQTLSQFNRTSSLISLTSIAERTRRGATVNGSLSYANGEVSGLSGFLADQQIIEHTFLPRPSQTVPAALAAGSVTVEGSRLFAAASYATEIDSCIVAAVNVTAEFPTGEAARADVSVTEVDNCAGGNTIFEAAGQIALPPGALTIATDLSSARLTTTADVAGQLLTLNLTWTGGQALEGQTLRQEFITPTETVTTVMQGKFSTAILTGSVSIPAHTIPVPENSTAFIGSEFAGTTTTQ